MDKQVDEHLFSIFRSELISQCELSKAGSELLDAEVEALIEGRKRHQDGIWLILQGIVSIAGDAASLLWGKGMKTEPERTALRDIARVSTRSPLRSRKVRNAFAHFDERIEEWYEEGDTDAYASRIIGQYEFPPRGSRFGHWDPQSGQIIFRDDVVSVPTYWMSLRVFC